MPISKRPLVYLLVALTVGASHRVISEAELLQPAPKPAGRSGAGPPTTPLTPELRDKILAAMRLNRQAFQEEAVLKRYGESRLPAAHEAFVACDLPRTTSGEPAAVYPAAVARATPRPYPEVKVVDCLGTTGGLDGTRASPLAQHYYCSLPGLSPDIRGCFTFQLRLPRVSRTRSAWDNGFLADGTKLSLKRGWNFLGPDRTVVPDVKEAFTYCATDGRPHTITNLKGRSLNVEKIHPKPTRPMCWVVQTQAELFQGIMGRAINPPLADQRALLKEYYECGSLKSKVSAARFKALCGGL